MGVDGHSMAVRPHPAVMARPASFVVDRAGVVRHAYVAESEANVADRPSAAELQAMVEATR